MSDDEQLTITEAVNDPAITQNMNRNVSASGSMVDRIKNSFKRHTLWWIIGIIVVVIIIGLIVWGIIALVKRGKSETFVPFDPQSNADHSTLNIVPETSYLETYISSALGVN